MSKPRLIYFDAPVSRGEECRLLTAPQPDEADWLGVVRAPYGTEVVIPKGPAKGFVIGEAITGPKRG